MKPIILPAARDDILRQFRYYLAEQDKPKVAECFLSAVRGTMERIIRTPLGGAPKRLSREALRGLRSWPVKGFEDVRIYYLAHEGGVRVVRVLHGKCDIVEIEPGKEGKEATNSRLPVFYSRGGEPLEIPQEFRAAVEAVTRGILCVGCNHRHCLVPPAAAGLAATNSEGGNLRPTRSVDRGQSLQP